MHMQTACQALREGKCLELGYDGFTRRVEVHVCGWTQFGVPIMRAWQVAGGSRSGERRGWKLMRLDEAAEAVITDQPSAAPRPGFKRSDPAIERIVCES